MPFKVFSLAKIVYIVFYKWELYQQTHVKPVDAMAIALFVSVCLLSLIITAVSPKRIHLFELLFVWMITAYIRANAFFFHFS